MSEDTFKRKIEPICHIIPNVYASAGASYLLAGQHFNSMGNLCWISAVPPNCINDPDVECIRGDEMAHKYRDWFFGFSLYAAFAIITINMLLIVWTVFVQNKKSDQWRFGSSAASDSYNGGRCFPCTWSIFSSRGISVSDKESDVSTNSAAIQVHDAENQHHQLAPLEDCLQPVKSPKVSPTLTTTRLDPRPGTIRQASKIRTPIFGPEGKEDERIAFPSSTLQAGSRRLGAPPSRAGNAKDPYAFDLRKVKCKIKIESKSADVTMLRGMPIRSKSCSNIKKPQVQVSDTSHLHTSVASTCSFRTAERLHLEYSERRKVVLQSALYIGCFFITWIFSVLSLYVISC